MVVAALELDNKRRIVEIIYNYFHHTLTNMSSEHDRAVLNCIFNPLLPVGELIYEDELPHNLQGWPLVHCDITICKEPASPMKQYSYLNVKLHFLWKYLLYMFLFSLQYPLKLGMRNIYKQFDK